MVAMRRPSHSSPPTRRPMCHCGHVATDVDAFVLHAWRAHREHIDLERETGPDPIRSTTDYSEHARLAAPWQERRRNANGEYELGPEYFPISCRTLRAVSYAQAKADYLASTASGGLWDWDEDYALGPRRTHAQETEDMKRERKDGEDMKRFLDTQHKVLKDLQLTKTELFATMLFFEQGRSYGFIRRELRLEQLQSAKNLIQQSRRKLRIWQGVTGE